MRIKLTVNYIGTGFVGWQSQKGGGSIQDCIEDAIFRLCGERVRVNGSGRTDAGVHAWGQTAHFDIAKDFDTRRIMAGLNFYLPQTVRISAAEQVAETFDARKSATRKTYVYTMYRARADNALLAERAVRVDPDIDLGAMKQAAAVFLGRHDFYAFMSLGSSAKTTERTIFRAEVEERPLSMIVFTVCANGFLYNMVRKMAAAIIRAGLGKTNADEIAAVLANGDRAAAKDLAPACALYLHDVEY